MTKERDYTANGFIVGMVIYFWKNIVKYEPA
jgi:hypothetical protein